MIYSLMAVKAICEREGKKATYYIHHNHPRFEKLRTVNTYDACKELFEAQPYIAECLPYASQRVDYDLDTFRKQAGNFKRNPLPNRFFRAVGLEPPKEFKPWLTIEEIDPNAIGKVFYNHTATYTNHGINTRTIVPSDALFIGTIKEHLSMGKNHQYFATRNLYSVAKALRVCEALYCNQSACLTIAQGLGVPVFLMKDKAYDSTVLNLENVL